MKRIFNVGLTVVALVLFIGGCGKSDPAGHGRHDHHAAQTAHEQDFARHPAPDFTLTDHADNAHHLADYQGKVVVLEWINPECPFVVMHHETKTTMVDLANAYADRDVVWLAVNSTSHFDRARNKALVERLNLPYPVLTDQDGAVGRLYGATRTPEMVVIDKSGNVAYHGAIDDNPRNNKPESTNYVKNALDEVLAGKPVSLPKTDPYGCTIKWAE